MIQKRTEESETLRREVANMIEAEIEVSQCSGITPALLQASLLWHL
jgi:hypothetical protein